MNPYKTREGGATVTIFVPYDCGNHCPFCINKQEYAHPAGFSLDRICESTRLMYSITPRCDFVFTGGEPFADLDALQRMLDIIPATHKIYVNTTFPDQQRYTAEEMLAFTERNREKITCINVSRHLVKYVEESDDAIVGRIATRKRINCVLFRQYPAEQLPAYVARFLPYGIPIQFRYDYTETTPENLYDEKNDRILQDLRRMFTYRGLEGCRMRNGFHFEYKGLHMTYHKTLPYSTIRETDKNGVTYDILYDILIKQTGEIHSDWDGTKLDVEAYRHVVYEPYDLRVLNGTVDFPPYRPAAPAEKCLRRPWGNTRDVCAV